MYWTALILSVFLSMVITPLMILVARRLNILDFPSSARKIHKAPLPLLGGLGVFISFFLILAGFIFGADLLPVAKDQTLGAILPKNIWGIFAGSLILMIVGFVDDKYDLRPRYQLLGSLAAVLVVIASGVGIDFITNPFGGLIRLDTWRTELFDFQGIPYRIFWIADFFTFIWLMTMMYTTKLLDGLDGLVTGITAIAAFFIFFLSLQIQQPFTALMALILAGSNLGFLFFNFNPAKIFLGEGGSLWAGFMLGSLAIISGGKVATTLLILGIPLLDLLWVVFRRVFKDKSSWSKADKKHLHHR